MYVIKSALRANMRSRRRGLSPGRQVPVREGPTFIWNPFKYLNSTVNFLVSFNKIIFYIASLSLAAGSGGWGHLYKLLSQHNWRFRKLTLDQVFLASAFTELIHLWSSELWTSVADFFFYNFYVSPSKNNPLGQTVSEIGENQIWFSIPRGPSRPGARCN